MKYVEQWGRFISARAVYIGVSISAILLQACISDDTGTSDKVRLAQRVTLYAEPKSYTEPVAELSEGEYIYPECRLPDREDPETSLVLVTATQEQKEIRGYVIEAFVPNMKRNISDCG